MPLNHAEVKRRRELLTFTLDEAARRAGFKGPQARVQWHDIESGKKADPRISTVERVAAALGCLVDDLLVKDKAAPRQKRSLPSGSAGSKG
jgi:transcriptional regulator with XRE-family HTH domain